MASMIVLADRTELVIADENSSHSEIFVLQPQARSDTSDTFRLERLHRLIRQRELDLLSSSGLDILSRDDDDDDDEEVGNGSSVLVEATTTRDGEIHSQYLFEDLKVFTNVFCERHLNLLRAVRNDGPVKPAVLAKRLDLDLSRVLSDLRDLASLGLIDETRRGVRVDYDELTVWFCQISGQLAKSAPSG
jgi:predicted transcriptional regulator